MSDTDPAKFYAPAEERINIGSHALGLGLSCIGLFFLIYRALTLGTAIHVVSFAVFGMSMIITYAASTVYHSTREASARVRMRVVDHAAIYVLIAGSATPVALITLDGTVGWILFSAMWSMAAIGIALKLFFTGRFNVLSTLMYLLMGWMVVLTIKPLAASLPPEGLAWLMAGGISYTVGAILYSIKRIHFNHAIFHIFVLAGTICHFIFIYFFVLPGASPF
jgi:hemolysin III